MSKRGFCFAKANHKVNHQPNHQLGLLSLSLSLSLSSNFLFLYDEGATINREAITTAFFSHRRNPLLAKTLFFLMHTLTPIFSHTQNNKHNTTPTSVAQSDNNSKKQRNT